MDFLPASLNVLRPEKESLLYKRLLKDKMLIEGANDIKIIWSDKRIKILADLFQNFYNHKKIWRIYIWVSILHELIYELKFLNVRPDSASLLKRVDDILLEINDKNYEFLLDIISEITLDKENEELFSMFDIFLDNIENSYISKFKILYREIRKEIEISKKILKYNHSIL